MRHINVHHLVLFLKPRVTVLRYTQLLQVQNVLLFLTATLKRDVLVQMLPWLCCIPLTPARPAPSGKVPSCLFGWAQEPERHKRTHTPHIRFTFIKISTFFCDFIVFYFINGLDGSNREFLSNAFAHKPCYSNDNFILTLSHKRLSLKHTWSYISQNANS